MMLTAKQLSKIQYLRNEELKYKYPLIISRYRGSLFAFNYTAINGVVVRSPFYDTPEEAVYWYETHPEKVPRLDNNIEYIKADALAHMISAKSVCGWKGVSRTKPNVLGKVMYQASYKTCKGQFVKILMPWNTPIEAAWSVKDFYSKATTEEIDHSVLELYESDRNKYGYKNIVGSNGKYKAAIRQYHTVLYTKEYGTVEEAVWAMHQLISSGEALTITGRYMLELNNLNEEIKARKHERNRVT